MFTQTRMHTQTFLDRLNCKSDPILQDEKFANKFKFSVGDCFVQKIRCGQMKKNVGQFPGNDRGNLDASHFTFYLQHVS